LRDLPAHHHVRDLPARQEMKMPIRIGVVGLGRAGWSLHVKPLAKNPQYTLVSVADPIAERRHEAETAFGVAAYATRDEMLEAGNLDVVVVASPTMFHAADAAAILNGGLDCILEKPMTATLAEAVSLQELAARRGRQLFVHHIHLFRPLFHHLRESVEGGKLGSIFELQLFWGGYRRRMDWQALRKNGGGLLANYGSHVFSIILPLLDGPVERVTCEVRNIKDSGDAEDHVHLGLHTAGGQAVYATITSAAAMPAQQIIAMGRHGTLLTDGKTTSMKYYDPLVVPAAAIEDSLAATGRKYITEELPWQEIEMPAHPAAPPPSFYDCVASAIQGRPGPLVANAAALEVMRVLDLAQKAAGLA